MVSAAMTKLFCWVNTEYEHSESAPRCSDCLQGRQQCSLHLATFLFQNTLQLRLGKHVWTQQLFTRNILKHKETGCEFGFYFIVGIIFIGHE